MLLWLAVLLLLPRSLAILGSRLLAVLRSALLPYTAWSSEFIEAPP